MAAFINTIWAEYYRWHHYKVSEQIAQSFNDSFNAERFYQFLFSKIFNILPIRIPLKYLILSAVLVRILVLEKSYFYTPLKSRIYPSCSMTPQEGFTAPHQLSSCSGLTHLFRSWLIIPSNTEPNSLSGSWPAVWRAGIPPPVPVSLSLLKHGALEGAIEGSVAAILLEKLVELQRWLDVCGDSCVCVCVQNLFQLWLETNFFLCNDHLRAPGTCKKPVHWASFEMRMSWPEQQGNLGVEKRSCPEYVTEVSKLKKDTKTSRQYGFSLLH